MVLKRFSRWRHSKGFGVHSPYAFRFVREVLRTSRGYTYYAYPDIDAELRRTRSTLSRSTVRLIFRLLTEFKPSTVTIASEHSAELLKFIVHKACPAAEIIATDGEMLICDGMAKAAPAACHAIFTNKQNPAATASAAALRKGHIYKSNNATIIAAYPHLPLQTFEVRF